MWRFPHWGALCRDSCIRRLYVGIPALGGIYEAIPAFGDCMQGFLHMEALCRDSFMWRLYVGIPAFGGCM